MSKQISNIRNSCAGTFVYNMYNSNGSIGELTG